MLSGLQGPAQGYVSTAEQHEYDGQIGTFAGLLLLVTVIWLLGVWIAFNLLAQIRR